MIIKVCGMRDADNIKAVEQLDIDLMGLVFYPQVAPVRTHGQGAVGQYARL